MSDEEILDVRVSVNRFELRRLIQEEVKGIMRTMLTAPVGELADELGGGAPVLPKPRREPKASIPRTNSILRAAPVKKSGRPEGSIDDILKVLTDHPEGMKGSELRSKLNWSKGTYSSRMSIAKEKGLVKMTGEKTAAIYFPVAKAIAKHTTNGALTQPN